MYNYLVNSKNSEFKIPETIFLEAILPSFPDNCFLFKNIPEGIEGPENAVSPPNLNRFSWFFELIPVMSSIQRVYQNIFKMLTSNLKKKNR